MDQKRVAILISYLNLIMGMAINIFLTPLMIKSFGDVDYSVYKVMQSFAGPLAMFRLGVSTVVTRSVIRCQINEDYTERDKQNTMALAMIVSVMMSVIVIVVGVIMYMAIPVMYGNNYEAESLILARKIFLMFLASSIVHMMTDVFSGCVGGHEKFIFSSSVTLLKTTIKLILIYIFIRCGMNIFFVAIVDLVIEILKFVLMFIYSVFGLSEIPKFYYFDKMQMIEIFSFGIAILLQAIINQVNNNMDTMILGAFIEEKSVITMYSSALAIYAIYNSIISVITGFLLPNASKLVSRNASGKELTDFVIAPGRVQAILAVACIFGFALFGRNFITIWIGEKYMDAYWITLVLMIPVTIPLVENAAISILDAALKRIYRSIVLVIMAVINVIISIILVKVIGFWGAAIGTFSSLIVGHGILMNIYYAKTFKMEIFRMFYSIFKGILPAGVAVSIICLPLSVFLENTVSLFFIKCTLFMMVYIAFLWIFGINKSEKMIVKKMFGKINSKRRG